MGFIPIAVNIYTMAKAAKKATTKKVSPKKGGATVTPVNSMLLEFFKDELKDIYWAEKKLVSTLPKLGRAATSKVLKDAFEEHLAVTKIQVTRLEKVFALLGKKAEAKKCEAMAGIVKEGESIIEETEKGTSTRDVGLILAAQKAEHYEISTYGGLADLANNLGLEKVAALLHKTLEEEKHADSALSNVANTHVNYAASVEKA
ncbi:MAG: ferritin-like protein [Sediminibacterium sp.]|nr:ferritin-like protein [Sediminibacterium sp.]